MTTSTLPDVSPLIESLNYFYPLSSDTETFLRTHCKAGYFKKGKLILKEGEICRHIYFIRKGIVRGFIKEGDKDITTWITAERELVTSIYGLDAEEPARENMQAIEDCSMLVMANTDINRLYELFPESNIVTRKLLQRYYKDAEGRAFIARLASAESKYKHFLVQYGHLANRVPLKYIASFLGITLETLSRIRKKLSLN